MLPQTKPSLWTWLHRPWSIWSGCHHCKNEQTRTPFANWGSLHDLTIRQNMGKTFLSCLSLHTQRQDTCSMSAIGCITMKGFGKIKFSKVLFVPKMIVIRGCSFSSLSSIWHNGTQLSLSRTGFSKKSLTLFLRSWVVLHRSFRFPFFFTWQTAKPSRMQFLPN